MNSEAIKKILIVGQQSNEITAITQELQSMYDLIIAHNGAQCLKLLNTHQDVSCIILEQNLPDTDGLSITHRLKGNFETNHIPVILITAAISPDHIVNAIHMGIDDYIKTPLNISEIQARIFMNLQRAERDQNTNPLTKLPGNAMINNIINARLNRPLAIMYADLDHFKVYNDTYGFEKGDQIIIATAQLFTNILKREGNSSDFLGHLGGDDFILISTPDKAPKISSTICEEFDQQAPRFYDEKTREIQQIQAQNREGIIQTFPLISLSIAIISNEHRLLHSLAQIAHIAIDLKKYAKSKPNGAIKSNFVLDRRSS